MVRDLIITPDKGMYSPGDPVRLVVGMSGANGCLLRCSVVHLDREIDVVEVDPIEQFIIEWQPPTIARAYGANIELLDADGNVVAGGTTAFDVANDWTNRPRYGFLTDFSPHRGDVDGMFAELRRFHINGIQFYDWMYRHDDPVPPDGDVFDDPLGREMSTDTIRQLIVASHSSGMAAMAYLAVYGASMDMWREHKDWAMYDREGTPHIFEGDFLGLMDPTRGGGWAEHLLSRCVEVLEAFEFDGIHIDQYGEPRAAYTPSGVAIDLPQAFVDFVVDLKDDFPSRPTTFNAVKNWPIEELVQAPMDFIYIELWPDMPTHIEAAEVVASNLELGGYRPVIVAQYIPAAWEHNILLANALILASGGSRIEVGESGRLLADPYFPLHQPLSDDLRKALLRLADFRVRYAELLDRSAPPPQFMPTVPDGVWTTVNDVQGWRVVHVVNLVGRSDARWDREHGPALPLPAFVLIVPVTQPVEQVMAIDPAARDQTMRPIHWRREGEAIVVSIDALDEWLVVAVRYRSTGVDC